MRRWKGKWTGLSMGRFGYCGEWVMRNMSEVAGQVGTRRALRAARQCERWLVCFWRLNGLRKNGNWEMWAIFKLC